MKRIAVVFQNTHYGNEVGSVKMAKYKTKEELVIDEAARTWRFADKKLEWFGIFPFGRGPTNKQKMSRYVYPKTLTVIDAPDYTQLGEALNFISASAFGSGYESGGAIDAD